MQPDCEASDLGGTTTEAFSLLPSNFGVPPLACASPGIWYRQTYLLILVSLSSDCPVLVLLKGTVRDHHQPRRADLVDRRAAAR